MFSSDQTPSWLYAIFVVGLAGTLLFLQVFALFTLFGAVTLLGLIGILVGPVRRCFRRARRDTYDLGLLKEIHEREEIEAAIDFPVPQDADIYCPKCGHLFGAKFKVCPNCKWTP